MGARAQGVVMDLTSSPTLSQEHQNAAQDHVDRHVSEQLAAPQQEATVTLCNRGSRKGENATPGAS